MVGYTWTQLERLAQDRVSWSETSLVAYAPGGAMGIEGRYWLFWSLFLIRITTKHFLEWAHPSDTSTSQSTEVLFTMLYKLALA